MNKVHRRKRDSLLEYNRAVALYRLDRRAEGLAALKEAVEKEPPLREAQEILTSLTATSVASGAWYDYWFGAEGKFIRKVVGATIVGLLLAFLVIPFIRKDALSWLITGQDFKTVIVPAAVAAALLLLPSVRSFKVGSVQLEPMDPGTDRGSTVPAKILGIEPRSSRDIEAKRDYVSDRSARFDRSL